MKHIKLLSVALLCLFFSSCGISRQKALIENLGKCRFDLQSVEQVSIAGNSWNRLIGEDGINLNAVPSIALNLLRADVPLDAVVNLKIDNTTMKPAAINQFQYIIGFQGKDFAEGVVNQKIDLQPGESMVVPVKISANIYKLLSDKEVNGFFTGSKGKDAKGMFNIKIKPSLNIGGKTIYYPGYITIDREISRKILL